jgi:hypothetical protein
VNAHKQRITAPANEVLQYTAYCYIMQHNGGFMVKNAVRLSVEFMETVTNYAPLNSRSVPKQIEHWAKIGKIAEENPDLPYQFIKGVLEAKSEMERGDVSVFEFRHK